MDAFYVSVEVREDPSLRGRPVVVGGTGDRGVVAAASYEARAFGIHSAMPSARARRLCPSLVFLPGRHDTYRRTSAEVHAILGRVTPFVEGIALDEAFLDVAGARRRLGDGPNIATALRQQLHQELGLWCSVGVAPRKLTAKLASESAKPRVCPDGPRPGPGVFVVEAADELAFLHAHPVEALWGVGPATLPRLQRVGLHTVGDLAALPEAALRARLGENLGRRLHALAWARDDSAVVADRRPKSLGHEETFAFDHHSLATLGREVVRLADAVAAGLRRAGLAGRTVHLKVRFADFRTISRSVTVPEPIDGGHDVVRVARRLLAMVDPSPGVRLLGVSVSQLDETAHAQLGFDDLGRRSWASATGAIDEVRRRFGAGAIVPAALVEPGGASTRVKRRGDRQWGPPGG
jgi:DNA polymerase-4